MAHPNERDLIPTSTDMMANMLGNTEKLISSDKQWNYAEHKDDDYSDEMDVDAKQFANESRKPKEDGMFAKPSEEIDDIDMRNGFSERAISEKKEIKNNNKHEEHNIEPNKKTDIDTDTMRNSERDTDTASLSRNEQMLLKLDMLRKLGELKQCGVHLSQNYNLDSELSMMQYEYRLHSDIRSKQNSVQWMSHMMIGAVKGVEFFNDSYNPFEMKLTGLTDKISSDMHNYYSVLGDIYEQYNQPGKQMHPVMRLVLMLSGAALSMQANRIMSNTASSVVKDEQNLNDLRRKAEDESRKKIIEHNKKEHSAAAQKASDIKMIQEKDLEFKKTAKMMDDRNTNMRSFKDNLMLSSEAPSKDTAKRKNSRPAPNNNHMTKEEAEMLNKMQSIKEQENQDMLRKTANIYQQGNNTEYKRQKELIEQNKQLDALLGNLNKESTKNTNSNKTTKHTAKSKETSSDNVSDNNRSVLSSASTSSVNPDIEKIMKKTSDKVKREEIKRRNTEQASAKKTTKTTKTIKEKKQNKTKTLSKKESEDEIDKEIVDTETGLMDDDTTYEENTNIATQKKLDEIKFDENIQALLDSNMNSGYDINGEISVGSKSSANNTSKSGSKAMEHGLISIGSKAKGTKNAIKIGIGKKTA